MRPEIPYIAAGGIAVVGATIRDNKLPGLGAPLLGIIALIIVASATTDTKLAPLVHAIGMVAAMGAAYATTRIIIDKSRNRKKS